MLFSIVTSFYNTEEKYINKLKNSILNQTYTKWEWVITDDFSDNIEDTNKIKELSNFDKRIRYVEQKFKKEIFWNPQTYCIGNVVLSVDADDSIYPKTLEVYYRMFLKFPEVILITSELNNFYENDNYSSNSYIDNRYRKNIVGGKYYGLSSNFFMGHCKCWKNVCVDFNPNIVTTKYIINDVLILSKLEELGKTLHLPRVFYKYIFRDKSISRHIDSVNNFSEPIVNYDLLYKDRHIEIDSIERYYEPIFWESISFGWTDLNLEKESNNISFLCEKQLEYYKMNILKDLYYDHNLYFNDIEIDNIDYYIIYMNQYSTLDYLKNIFLKIKDKPRKEMVISFVNENKSDCWLFNDVKHYLLKHINNFYWFDYLGYIKLIKI